MTKAGQATKLRSRPMSVSAVSLFLALIALLLAALVVVLVIGSLVAGRAIEPLRAMVRPVAYELATAVAVGSTLGSLYMSEVADYEPCQLCWVQRYFMYPAALLLIIGLFAKRRLFSKLALALAVGGVPVSILHRYEQASGKTVGNLCELDNPCSGKWVNEFGFVTIPTMAGIGFVAIIVFTALSLGWLSLGSGAGSEADS